MQIDPNSVIRGFEALQPSAPAVKEAVGVAITRRVLDSAETSVLTLLQGLQPNLGQHVDVRA